MFIDKRKMRIVKSLIFDVLVFGIVANFEIPVFTSAATELEVITTEILENGGHNTTFQVTSKTIPQLQDHIEQNSSAKINTKKQNIQRRKKIRRRLKTRRLGTFNSTISSLEPYIKSNSTLSTKKIILRRKKIRNRRKKLRNDGNVIELTTAKGIVFSTKTQLNETINKLIEKLNKNPEDNFEEFKNKKSNVEKLHVIKSELTLTNITELIRKNDSKVSISVPYFKIINRCKRNRGGCAHICHPKGKRKCSCLKGFYLGADQRSCHDIDECKINNGECETECVNLIGSYKCVCPEGLTLTDDRRSCQDVNECLLRNGHGPCQDTCQNNFGSYICSCNALKGTVLGRDGQSCEDVNECLVNNGGCSHTCINTFGAAFCSCPVGMELSSDWKTCQDVNECEFEAVSSVCKNCLNTEGSYICLDISDMQNDQSASITVCKPLFPPSRGFMSCTRKGAFQSFTKKGRKRTINSPGTICQLICPPGFKMIGEYRVICGMSGTWKGNQVGKCVAASPPILQCPPTQHVQLQNDMKKIQVKFPSPMTDIHWNYVKSHPRWAKDLQGNLTQGHYIIRFTARDPNTRLLSTCSFKIIVDKNKA